MIDALVGRRLVLDMADAQAHGAIGRSHFLGIAGDQIVVDGDDVHRLAAPAPDAGGQRGGDRLALAGGHFGDETFAHGQRAHHLHRIRALADSTEAAFANDGHAAIECFVFESIESRQNAAFFDGFSDSGSGKSVNLRLELFNPLCLSPQPRQHATAILHPANRGTDHLIRPAQIGRFHAPGVKNRPEFMGGRLAHFFF